MAEKTINIEMDFKGDIHTVQHINRALKDMIPIVKDKPGCWDIDSLESVINLLQSIIDNAPTPYKLHGHCPSCPHH